MEEKEIQEQLASIRGIMERSSKFISLSGLSGILAGIYALIGAGLAYGILSNYKPQLSRMPENDNSPLNNLIFADNYRALEWRLILIAFFVLLLSIITGIILSYRKARRKGQPFWNKVSQSLIFYMATPLVTGGFLIIIFILHGHYSIIAPASLIFYGLSLVGASNFTFTMVKYLGLFEILLGLITACLPGYGLLFWAIGFGVLHIIYGGMMYLKYDR